MSRSSRKKNDDTRDLARLRSRAQVEVVLEALKGQVGVAQGDSDDLADFDYLYRLDHILVRDSDLDRVLRVIDGASRSDNLVNGLTRLALPSGRDLFQVLDELDAELGVGVATPDHVMWVTPTNTLCPATEPEEPTSTAPVPSLNTRPSDGKGVFVSVIDTGWHSPAATDPTSPWLAGVTGDEETIDPAHIHPYAGHGTFIAGVVRCEAPQSEIRVEGFLTHGGAVFESEMIKQLAQGLALGPDIISMSAGMVTRGNRPPLGFEVFYANFLSQVSGTVLVAAAGNDGTRAPFWPAAFPWSIAVGAIDAAGERATFSNYGSWVDVYALGVDMVNAYPHGDYTCVEPPDVGEVRHFTGLCQWSGTSFSTPVVAGRIATRMSRSGLTARLAADELLAEARANAIPGVGAVL